MAALSVLVLGLFMTLLDLTIVNVAIPSILDGLHASLDQVLWVLNAYSLLYAVLLITSARLGDIHGPRKMFAIGVVIFTVASAFSGLAQDPTQLILARALQGLGSAVLAPQSLPLMMSLFPVEKRGGVFAIYGVIAGLLYHQARRNGPKDSEPLLPFDVFKDRNFTLMTLVMAAMGFAILGIYLPLTIYMQSVLGLSPVDAGLTLAIQPLAMFFSSGIASGLVQKVNGKYLLIPGLLALAAGTGYIDWAAQAHAGRWDFTPGLILSGLGMGCIWTPVFTIGTRDLPAHLGGVASGVINSIQEMGGVFASAVVGAFLQNRLALALHDRAVAASSQLPDQYRQP